MVYSKLSSVCKDHMCTKVKVLKTFSFREKVRAWPEFHTKLDYCNAGTCSFSFTFSYRYVRTCSSTVFWSVQLCFGQFNCVLVSLMSVVTTQCLYVLHLLQTLTTSLLRGLVPTLDLAPVSLPLIPVCHCNLR